MPRLLSGPASPYGTAVLASALDRPMQAPWRAHASPGPTADAAQPAPLVLVVDDDAQIRAYIRTCLTRLPVRVAEAVDGQDALARIEAWDRADLALVITDILMPQMDGRALKAALHTDRRWTDVPVLLITGEAVRVRDGPVLKKPFNARRLGAAVRTLLDL